MANLSNINNILRTDSLGVGINRDPLGVLEVSSATRSGIKMFNTGSSGRTYETYVDASGNYIIYDVDADRNDLVINSSGNAAIGMNPTTEKLDVNGRIRGNNFRLGGSDSTVFYGMYRAGTETREVRLVSYEPTPNSKVQLGMSNLSGSSYTFAPALTVKANLRVGIGTIDPLNILHIKDTGVILRIEDTVQGFIGFIGDANAAGDGVDGDFGIRTANNMTFMVGGSLQKLKITSTGNVEQGLVGTSASGYYYFNATTGGDTGLIFRDNASTNSGFLTYNHSIDAMKFATGGTERMRIDSSGQLNLTSGTYHKLAATFPSTYETVLQIGLQATISAEALSDTITFAHSGTEAVSDYVFKVAGNPKLIIKGTGNVGIGTTSPYAQLHVSHSLGNGGIMLGNTATTGSKEMLLNIHPLGLIWQRWVNGAYQANLMTLDYDGNLGIGTTSPGTKLEISDGTGPTIRLRRADNSVVAGDLIGGIENYNQDADGAHISSFIRGYATETYGRQGYLTFGTSGVNSTDATEKMRITSGGFTKAKANGGNYFNGSYHEFVNNNNVSGDRCLVIGNKAGSATNNTSSISFIVADGAGDRLYIYGNGNVVNLNNSYGALSDVKLKENIVDATSKLDDLMKVKIRNYNLIGDDKKQIGVVAQELEEVFPAMIDESIDYEDKEVTDEEGNVSTEKIDLGTTTKSVKYSVFVPMLIKSIQEQQVMLKELKAEVDKLKQECKCKN